MSNSRSQLIVCLSALLLLLSPAGAQPSDTPTDAYGQYQNFSPSMAVIIVVLIAALFFMGFFSIYIRHCSDSSAVGSVRQLGASLRRRAAARGLERSVIEGFPTFVYAEVKEEKIGKGALECAVCLNEFENDDTLRLIPKCDHVFHPECIDAWLESHVTCPVCRANLSPQQGEAVESAESQNEPAETVNRTDGEVSIQITDDQPEQQEAALPPLPPPPQGVDRNQSVNRNRPPRSRSVRPKLWPRFPRSHSTGHSLVQPGENTDRFTLRLPQDVRKQMMTRALKRTTSCVMPTESSSRRGYRTGSGEGSSRGGRSFKRLDSMAKSDRWVFSMAPPFFSRASSIRSPRVMAADGQASTSATTPRGTKTAMKLPSFKCLEPKDDEAKLVFDESKLPPV